MVIGRHLLVAHHAEEIGVLRFARNDVVEVVRQALEVEHGAELAFRLLEVTPVTFVALAVEDDVDGTSQLKCLGFRGSLGSNRNDTPEQE